MLYPVPLENLSSQTLVQMAQSIFLEHPRLVKYYEDIYMALSDKEETVEILRNELAKFDEFILSPEYLASDEQEIVSKIEKNFRDFDIQTTAQAQVIVSNRKESSEREEELQSITNLDFDF